MAVGDCEVLGQLNTSHIETPYQRTTVKCVWCMFQQAIMTIVVNEESHICRNHRLIIWMPSTIHYPAGTATQHGMLRELSTVRIDQLRLVLRKMLTARNLFPSVTFF
jgi:hypothetical protein